MNKERLERVAVLLDNYRDGGDGPTFDLHTWGEYAIKRGGFLWLQKHPCDTAACAVGLACLSGEFENDGLSFYRHRAIDQIDPVYLGAFGMLAVQRFFDLTEKQARRLFIEETYGGGPVVGVAGARRVAKRIRQMIAPRKRTTKPKSGAPAVFTALLNTTAIREDVGT